MRATMPCLAFEFRPPTPRLNDPTGIAAPQAHIAHNYSERALTVLGKVSAMQNLDQRLADDAVERAELIEETRSRLANIGYSSATLQGLQ